MNSYNGYNGYNGVDHIGIVPIAAQQFPAWTQDRFAGKAADSNYP